MSENNRPEDDFPVSEMEPSRSGLAWGEGIAHRRRALLEALDGMSAVEDRVMTEILETGAFWHVHGPGNETPGHVVEIQLHGVCGVGENVPRASAPERWGPNLTLQPISGPAPPCWASGPCDLTPKAGSCGHLSRTRKIEPVSGGPPQRKRKMCSTGPRAVVSLPGTGVLWFQLPAHCPWSSQTRDRSAICYTPRCRSPGCGLRDLYRDRMRLMKLAYEMGCRRALASLRHCMRRKP